MRTAYIATVALSVVCVGLALIAFLTIPFTKVPTEQSLAAIESVAAKSRMVPKDLAAVKVLVSRVRSNDELFWANFNGLKNLAVWGFAALGVSCLLVVWLIGKGDKPRLIALDQNRGEALVREALTLNFSSPSYHLLNNVTLPIKDGTTQVDHILVSRYGVFVIETKHYTGSISGDPYAAEWTQVRFSKQYKFQNPIRQNYLHVAAVAELLDFLPSDQIHSIVVFTSDATFKTGRPPQVVMLGELTALIDKYSAERLTQNRMHFCVGRLECHRKAISGQTDVEHVEHLRRRFGHTA